MPARVLVAVTVIAGCVAVVVALFVWSFSLHRKIPGDARPGHPATVTAHRGDTVRLAPKVDNHSATCTITPVSGEARKVELYGVDDQNVGGWIGEAWWDGDARLDCDRRVDGTVGPWYSIGVQFAVMASVLVLACVTVWQLFRAFDP